MEKTTHSAEVGVTEKHARKDKSDTEMDTEAGGKGSTSHSHSRCKKGHIINMYLKESEEAIVDFVKHHKELYNKTDEHFQDKTRKESLWQRFATVASCLPRCTTPGLSRKGHIIASSHNPSLVRHQKR